MREFICASAVRLDLGDERFRLLRGSAVVNQHMCTRVSKRQRSGSSNSTGSSRHKRSFVVLNHCYLPPLHELPIKECASDLCRKEVVKILYRPETPARKSCHRDKSDRVHPVPKRLSVRA